MASLLPDGYYQENSREEDTLRPQEMSMKNREKMIAVLKCTGRKI
jgi:hypothetical protein